MPLFIVLSQNDKFQEPYHCIVSCNVNGINNKLNKAQILAHIELLNADVMFLGDTCLGPNGQADCINSYCNYIFFFNSLSSKSRGTDILIKRTCPMKVLVDWTDDLGNINILSTNYDGERIVYCVVYGIHVERPGSEDLSSLYFRI